MYRERSPMYTYTKHENVLYKYITKFLTYTLLSLSVQYLVQYKISSSSTAVRLTTIKILRKFLQYTVVP